MVEKQRDELLYILEEDTSNEINEFIYRTIQSMEEGNSVFTYGPETASNYYLDALHNFRQAWELYLEDQTHQEIIP